MSTTTTKQVYNINAVRTTIMEKGTNGIYQLNSDSNQQIYNSDCGDGCGNVM